MNWLAGVILGAALLQAGTEATTQGKNVSNYVFLPDTGIKVQVRSGLFTLYGTIGADGSFVMAEVKTPKKMVGWGGGIGISPYRDFVEAPGEFASVYEFRSGKLVPGRIVGEKFVPDTEGRIIDFKDYRYSPKVRRIYNLPGRFVLRSRLQHDG